MPGKTFLDTEILVCAVGQDSAPRRDTSRKVIESVVADGSGVISTQVMQEFYVAATRTLGMPPLAAKTVLNTLSFRDALIIAAAASAGCAWVFTEDLHAGQSVLGVAIENPLV